MKVYDEIVEIAKEVLGQDDFELKSEQEMVETGLNSITFIKIMVGIEEHFDIEIDDKYLDFERYRTIGEFCDVIESLVNEEQ